MAGSRAPKAFAYGRICKLPVLQAATLAALAMAGLVDVYEHRNKTNEVCGLLCTKRKGCLSELALLCRRCVTRHMTCMFTCCASNTPANRC